MSSFAFSEISHSRRNGGDDFTITGTVCAKHIYVDDKNLNHIVNILLIG